MKLKKLIFYIVENSNDKPEDILFKTHKNSLLYFENNKHYFSSHYSGKEEINIYYGYIEFNEELFTELKSFIKYALVNATKISEEEIEWDENKINLLSAPIFSEINKYSYHNPKSIFEFIGNIFVMHLMGHKLSNGNKRFSLAFLILILRHFGYHLNWSQGSMKNYLFHKTQIENFVKLLQIDYNKGAEEVIEWITNSCVIALNFRKGDF